MKRVFITGGSGYLGRRLIPLLLQQGREVVALVRPGSERKLPRGCTAALGNALDGTTYAADVRPGDTFVQLVGVPHPSPAKAKDFVSIDQKSAMEAIRVASHSGVAHFIYVSVAQPAPVMRAYIAARSACEDALRASGLNATIFRPWYVLGPGHWWPAALLPAYWVFERVPATRDSALRLGLVTVQQMVRALADAVDDPATGVRVVEVPRIREGTNRLAGSAHQ